MRHMRQWIGRGRGATATEYMVMLILSAMFILAIIRVFGSTISEKFTNANDELSGTLASDSGNRGRSGAKGDSKKSAAGASSSEAAGAGGGKSASGGSSGDGSGASGGSGSSASGGGSGASGGGGDESSTGGGGDESSSGGGPDGAKSSPDKSGGDDGGCVGDPDKRAGFNPAVLFAAFLLVGLLIYVMLKGKQ